MKIYDITQELFSCVVFPGDPAPQKNTLCSMSKGDLYNLTSFSMCAHNGTHIDAPSHFIIDGKNIDEIERAAYECGALSFAVSGAGPACLVFSKHPIYTELSNKIKNKDNNWQAIGIAVDNEGAKEIYDEQ